MNVDLPRIPRVIHQIWIPNWKSSPKDIRESRAKWCELNPDWDYQFWDEQRVESLLMSHFQGPIYELWTSLGKEYIIKKADLARLVIAYRHGGIYADMDLIPMRPLTVNEKSPIRSMVCVPELGFPESHHRVANGFFGCLPRQDFIFELILKSADRAFGPVLDFLGPKRFGEAVWQHYTIEKDVQFLPYDLFLSVNPTENAYIRNMQIRSWGDHSKARWWKV